MNWPDLLPSPSVTLSMSHDPYVISNRMESGKLRQRPRFTTESQAYTVSVTLTMFEVQIFTAFHRYNLLRGSAKFSIDLPSLETGLVAKIEGIIPNGVYQMNTIAGKDLWKLSFTFLVENPSLISEDLMNVNFIYNGDADQLGIDATLLENELLHFGETGSHSWQQTV